MALLDQIDIKILQALQNNAKVNMKELSAELNISKTPVYERVKRLEEEGYIRNYVALVDNKKVGLPLVVFCNVSLAVHNDEHIQRFKAEIQEIDEVMECYSIGGIYDFFLKVVVKDLAAYVDAPAVGGIVHGAVVGMGGICTVGGYPYGQLGGIAD